jgi:non-specific protein-tyrosine kinase
MTEVDLNRYVRLVWKWLWLIALTVGIAAGASYYGTRSMPRMYLSSVVLMVGEDTVSANLSLNELALSQQLAALYAGMVTRQPVLEGTVQKLGLPIHWRVLQGRVVAVRNAGSQLLEIRVTDTDPQRARDTADEIARQLIQQSPTDETLRKRAEQRDFVRQQLDALQANIQSAEATLAVKQAALEKETSARGVLDLQDEIRALDLKVNTWRSTYASLLSTNQAKNPGLLSILEAAYVPVSPVSPDVRANVTMGAAVGLVLAIAAIFLIEYLRGVRLQSAEDISRGLGLAFLGAIAKTGRSKRPADALVAVQEPFSASAEGYRRVRTEIQFAWGEKRPVHILVTSPEPGEGKSITSANLAASFALAGKRTILVDADLRRPTLHALFGVANTRGLSSLLMQEDAPGSDASLNSGVLRQRVEERLIASQVPNLSICPAGQTHAANPGELLASARMKQIIETLGSMADVVVFDSPAVLPVTDPTILAGQGLGVVLVIEAGNTHLRTARTAHDALARGQARMLGAVLNKVSASSTGYKRYYRAANAPVFWKPLLRFFARG